MSDPDHEIPDQVGCLFCFVDKDRVCGPDCTAYVTTPRHSTSSELGSQQVHCAVISGIERLGRNMTIVAQTAVKKVKTDATREADKSRKLPDTPISTVCKSPFPIRGSDES